VAPPGDGHARDSAELTDELEEESMEASVDTQELEAKVKDMYRHVAEEPQGKYHFEMGRPLAERLGYPADMLDRIPDAAIESFAGVGYFFDLANLNGGERVVDLGSGSGMDLFFAAEQVGSSGSVVGIDFTVEQLEKARVIAEERGFEQVELREGRIEELPIEDASCDCVISNGVINLAPEKEPVFAEAARVLRPGGRLAIADIVSEQQMKESIVCDADLWASCIGGASQVDAYREAIEGAGLSIEVVRENPYEFISDRARNASEKYGVKSVSLLAVKRVTE
jgi:arsenite methyltransferase